jgi:hypothetical protein
MNNRRELLRFAERADRSTGLGSTAWISEEFAGCSFSDVRLGKRFHKLLQQFSTGIGGSIPFACQDWANTKGAYRFFSNDRVSEADILVGHFQATRQRFLAHDGPVLILHDTTQFSYHREDVAAIGVLHDCNTGRDKKGRLRHHTVCGLSMHSSLAVTLQGLPLGLAAIKFWTRAEFRGTRALAKKINPTRVPIEKKESVRWLENLRQSTALFDAPERCIHVGDRESDIYELFCTAQQVHTHFLIRSCVDRLAGDGSCTIADEMKEVRVQGLHRIQVRDKKGNMSVAVLEIRFCRTVVLPPIGKQNNYPSLILTVIYAQERGAPQGRDRIDWKLLTDLPVRSRKEAVEKVCWYAHRWKIETFHKILKSGCKAEEVKLRTADRLVNLLAVFCILSWRIFWMTMINRAEPDAAADLAFTDLELRLLDALVKDKAEDRDKTLATYLVKLARLGGYLARANDSPPGNMVMWRGLSRLTDIELGAIVGTKVVGN